MADDKQTDGRKANGAAPGGKPTPDPSGADVKKVGHSETATAGPDGPDVEEVAETFKHPDGRR